MKDPQKELKVVVETDSSGTAYMVITCPFCKKKTRRPILETLEKYKTERIYFEVLAARQNLFFDIHGRGIQRNQVNDGNTRLVH
jgi:hypothetical protein